MYKDILTVFEAFAGYGGASFALKRLRARRFLKFNVVGYSEIDQDAIEMYDLNFPRRKNYGNITDIDEKTLPDFNFFTGGFPCQPFSTIGDRMGEEDKTKGTLFHDIIRICSYKKPEFILLENVKGITVGKLKETYETILEELRRIGYTPCPVILNSKDYGIPQNRERLWIFAKRGELPPNFSIVPPQVNLKLHVKDLLDSNIPEDFYRTDSQLERIHSFEGVPKFEVNEPLCYDYYNRRIRFDGVCMAITPPEHNVVRIVEPKLNGKERLRKLTIDEHFRFMGFRIDDKIREIKYPNQTYTKLGRRAGNGWEINVVTRLLKHIFSQL